MLRTHSAKDSCQTWQLNFSHKITSCAPYSMDNFVGVYWKIRNAVKKEIDPWRELKVLKHMFLPIN